MKKSKSVVPNKSFTQIIFDKLKVYDKDDDTYAIRFTIEPSFSKSFLEGLEPAEKISFLTGIMAYALEKITEHTKEKIEDLNELQKMLTK